MANENEDFGRGEGVLTVVQRMPQGVAVTQGPASDERVQEAIASEAVDGIEVEVVAEPNPDAVDPLAAVSDDDVPDPDVEFVPADPLVEAVNEDPEPKRRGARASAFGPVGPDPEQEAARSVPVRRGKRG